MLEWVDPAKDESTEEGAPPKRSMSGAAALGAGVGAGWGAAGAWGGGAGAAAAML